MTERASDTDLIAGVILAGGAGRRMGGVDKFLLPLGRRPLLDRVIDRATPQVAELLLNINGDAQKVADYPLTVISDLTTARGRLGPLAGVLSAMHWLRNHRPRRRWLASFAADTPFFPPNLVTALYRRASRDGTPLAGASAAGRTHPVFSLWSLSLYQDLHAFLLREKQRRLHDFFARHQVSWVEFPRRIPDPFFNINTPQDLNTAQKWGFD